MLVIEVSEFYSICVGLFSGQTRATVSVKRVKLSTTSIYVWGYLLDCVCTIQHSMKTRGMQLRLPLAARLSSIRKRYLTFVRIATLA